MRVWEFDKIDEPGRPLIVGEDALDAIMEELKHSDVGDCYTVRVKEMTKDSLEALPEWDGF